jgi:inner membrane protein
MSTITEQAWSKGKVLIKGMMIAGLVLLLLIPTFYVQNLVSEREARQKEAIQEVSSKWAARQTITGPVIVIPYWQTDVSNPNKPISIKHHAYFLPDNLAINANVIPQEKHRGIYKVILYTSQINISGNMGPMPYELLKIPEQNILWNEGFVRIGISDLKGLNEELQLKWKDSTITLSPNAFSDALKMEGLSAPLSITNIQDLRNANFSAQINLSGSEELLFNPVGKNTTVHVASKWQHPSFTGAILPQATTIKDTGFAATWKSLAHTRSFPQQFKDEAISENVLNNASNVFGVDLFIPVNAYQKTMRSVKYAVLCILLTFAAFYLIETVNKRSVHPMQYALIGLALILFYTLLLSFSEYIGFDTAYIVASLSTIGLISWFVKGVLGSGKLSMFLALVLVLMYSYIFTILQLQDFALLLGSIGLFITLAIIMYFSRKMQW